MLTAVLSGFVLAFAAPWIHRLHPGLARWVLSAAPLLLAGYFASFAPRVAEGEAVVAAVAWVPALGVDLSFSMDGLGLLFAVLISSFAALVVFYASDYLHGHHQEGRFHAYILAFMASMLGVVLADGLLLLFVFWELTSVTSYLLIGFFHERDKARWNALQALLVTGLGGLALLCGLILMGLATGAWRLSEMPAHAELLQAHALYPWILLLVLAGAFTKSAQFPFHFWLPNAMEAPTPASAYLHAATMVKAGVYLLARLNPALGGTTAWTWAVAGFGAATMLVGAVLALGQRDLKRLLAYSTVSALGALTMLLGLGTEKAALAAAAFLLGHALYKGALFLVAGGVDHATGTRDVDRTAALARAMPLTAAAGVLAALSMAGLPPFFGFLGKESLYEAVLPGPAAVVLVAVSVAASALLLAVAVLVGIKPFFGSGTPRPGHPHEGGMGLWLAPLLLAAAGLAAGLFPGFAGRYLVGPAAASVLGRPVEAHLAHWHGANLPLLLSAATLAAGIAAFAWRARLVAAAAPLAPAARFGPDAGYHQAYRGLTGLALLQTRVLQHGYLRFYLATIAVVLVALVGGTFFFRNGFLLPGETTVDLAFHEALVAGVILLAAVAAALSRSRLGAIAFMGVVGFGVALVFSLNGAPDLAMTQFLVETLTVVLFVLVFYHLPAFSRISSRAAKLRDAAVAAATGGLVTLLILAAQHVQYRPPISDFFNTASQPQAHGRNVVNVILVDFRALDTLGEIVVLAVAGVGVFALLKLRLGAGGKEAP